jgi:hypothetical protein
MALVVAIWHNVAYQFRAVSLNVALYFTTNSTKVGSISKHENAAVV